MSLIDKIGLPQDRPGQFIVDGVADVVLLVVAVAVAGHGRHFPAAQGTVDAGVSPARTRASALTLLEVDPGANWPNVAAL